MKKAKTKNHITASYRLLLAIVSWIDSTLYGIFTSVSDIWSEIVLFFRRFRTYGIKRLFVEVLSDGMSFGLAGIVLLVTLAIPTFEKTQGNWLLQSDYSVTFLDRYGNEIGERGVRQKAVAPLETLPDHLIKAVLATEDRRFFDHLGIDFYGLVRAIFENVRANAVVQGGSTLTQQLAKNIFLTNERTLDRKIKEAFLSLWLEANLTKKEILHLYLNRAYMGGGNFGIQAAAEYYFGKDVTGLNMAESAMLAGLFKAPTKYAPHVNLPAARARANEVLSNMVEANFLEEGQIVDARRNPAQAIYRGDVSSPDYFLDWAFDEIQNIASDLKTRNLIAKTTIDLDLQKEAENAINSHLVQFGETYGVGQAAMVVMETDGAVRAIVGGRDYGESQFNRATSALRQPGSSFKPYVYAAAMELGMKPGSKLLDSPVTLGKWSPKNYGRSYRGRVTATEALVRSINTIPVKISLSIGRTPIIEKTKAMGVEAHMRSVPSIALGTNEMTVMDQATGYSVFANGGYEAERHGITQLLSKDGVLLYEHKREKTQSKRVLSEEATQSMNEMLVQVPQWGTAKRAALDGIAAAGKTGTTQAYRDAWFVGYTGNYVAAVWYGNDNYKPTKRLTGGRLPAMTWQQFMTYAHQDIELKSIPYIADESHKTKKHKDDVVIRTSKRRRGLSRQTAVTLRGLIDLFNDVELSLEHSTLAANVIAKESAALDALVTQ